MIISMDAEKAFDKIQHLFMIKTLNKLGIGGKYLNIIKAIYDKPTANLILNSERFVSFSSKIRNKTRVLALTTEFQYRTGSPSQGSQARKSNKIIRIGKEEVKLSLFADDMILYKENPKDSIKKTIRSNQKIQ